MSEANPWSACSGVKRRYRFSSVKLASQETKLKLRKASLQHSKVRTKLLTNPYPRFSQTAISPDLRFAQMK